MEPGGELNALVVEKVMGWQKYNEEPHGDYWRSDDGRIHFLDTLPGFSTDNELLDEIMKRMPRYTFQFERHHRYGCFCRIILPGECMVDRPTKQWESRGQSIMHAVCLAALQAMDYTTS